MALNATIGADGSWIKLNGQRLARQKVTRRNAWEYEKAIVPEVFLVRFVPETMMLLKYPDHTDNLSVDAVLSAPAYVCIPFKNPFTF